MPRISLIHAVHVAIEPVVETFQSDWPEAEVYSLLEDSLSRDLQTAGEIDSAMIGRFKRLADYAVDTGADRRAGGRSILWRSEVPARVAKRKVGSNRGPYHHASERRRVVDEKGLSLIHI